MRRSDIKHFTIQNEQTIIDAIECINRNAKGIALVVDNNRVLLGTVTDGDIRRIILKGIQIESPVQAMIDSKHSDAGIYSKPITASVDTDDLSLAELMKAYSIRQIPLINDSGQVMELVTWDEFIPSNPTELNAVVMAGGFGTRLRPLTEDIPKPMLPLGEKPLIERTVIQLRDAGVKQVNISTHYKPEKIIEHFGNGQGFGLDINYVNEEHPLGTGGALGLMAVPKNPLLVINGDIVTEVNFQTMYAYHSEHNAALTVAVRQYEYQVPYGVMESNGPFVQAIREKPSYHFFVNAGIYLLEPSVYQYIPAGEHFNMTDLIEMLIANNEVVVNFPIIEYWLDIGRHEDYEQAQADIHNGKVSV